MSRKPDAECDLIKAIVQGARPMSDLAKLCPIHLRYKLYSYQGEERCVECDRAASSHVFWVTPHIDANEVLK